MGKQKSCASLEQQITRPVGGRMAESTRRRTVYQIQQILKAYRAKLEAAAAYRDYLSAEGKALTDDYMSEDRETKRLIEDAISKPEFFLDMEDDALIRYSDVCMRLNRLLRLEVSGTERIRKIADASFFITSDAQRITSFTEVELGRTVTYNVGESARIDANDKLNQMLYDVEWEAEDTGGKLDGAAAKREKRIFKVVSAMKNAATDWPIISLLSDENPFEIQLKATRPGEYKIRAKIYKDFGLTKSLYDVIEFDQLVTDVDEKIESLTTFEKLKKALGMINWRQEIDLEALAESLWNSIPMILFMAALAASFGEIAAALIAIMSLADGCRNISDGFTKIAQGFEIIKNAGSENALKHGGELIHEGLIIFGLGTIEVFLSKCTMKNVQSARMQLLKGEAKAAARPGMNALPSAATKEIASSSGTLPALTEVQISEATTESARITSMALANVSANQSEMAILENINKGIAQIENVSVKDPKYNPCPDPSPYAKNAVEIIESHNQFVWNEPEARWLSPDGSRKIWFENVWKYEGENGIVEEFTVLEKYSMRNSYKTSTIGNKSFMQAHHGIQSDWAEENLGAYYNKKQAPVILLRDSCKGTPHEYVTNSQKHRSRNISYFEERNNLKIDLKNLNVSKTIEDNYLKETDDYFYSIYKRMSEDNVTNLDEIFDFDFKAHTQLSKGK